MITAPGSPLAFEDAARLHMSTADNPMLITALLALDRSIGHEELEVRLGARLSRHPRFRQRVIEPRLRMPRWVEDPTFDVRHHVHRIDASLVPGSASLEDLTGDLSSIPLAGLHPLWRAHLIDGPEPALVMIVHHALADGAALLALLSELADEDLPERRKVDETTTATATLRSRAWQIAAGALAASRLALQRPDPEAPLRRRQLGDHKRLAFSGSLSLEELRTTAHALDTTITGVLLTAVAGACRAELDVSERAEDLVLHALVPVIVSQRGSSDVLGNHYGSVLVPLPVGAFDLAARIRGGRDAARRLRSHGAGVAAARLAAAAGALSPFIERIGVELFSRRASVTVSSVRGPADSVHLCGAAVRDIMVWAPASGSIPLSVTLMSYDGRARIGVAADAHALGDARRIVYELECQLELVSSFAKATTA